LHEITTFFSTHMVCIDVMLYYTRFDPGHVNAALGHRVRLLHAGHILMLGRCVRINAIGLCESLCEYIGVAHFIRRPTKQISFHAGTGFICMFPWVIF
jgi:hypothetical protein